MNKSPSTFPEQCSLSYAFLNSLKDTLPIMKFLFKNSPIPLFAYRIHSSSQRKTSNMPKKAVSLSLHHTQSTLRSQVPTVIFTPFILKTSAQLGSRKGTIKELVIFISSIPTLQRTQLPSWIHPHLLKLASGWPSFFIKAIHRWNCELLDLTRQPFHCYQQRGSPISNLTHSVCYWDV